MKILNKDIAQLSKGLHRNITYFKDVLQSEIFQLETGLNGNLSQLTIGLQRNITLLEMENRKLKADFIELKKSIQTDIMIFKQYVQDVWNNTWMNVG